MGARAGVTVDRLRRWPPVGERDRERGEVDSACNGVAGFDGARVAFDVAGAPSTWKQSSVRPPDQPNSAPSMARWCRALGCSTPRRAAALPLTPSPVSSLQWRQATGVEQPGRLSVSTRGRALRRDRLPVLSHGPRWHGRPSTSRTYRKRQRLPRR